MIFDSDKELILYKLMAEMFMYDFINGFERFSHSKPLSFRKIASSKHRCNIISTKFITANIR